jgi:hypothetical protein
MPKRKVTKKARTRTRVAPAITRIAQRAFLVTDDDVRTYAPSELDLEIAGTLLSGTVAFKDIAEALGRSPAAISARLKNNVCCAWLSKHVGEQIQHRLGLIDSAMMMRALGGDVRAAEVMYRRLGQDKRYNVNVNVGTMNYEDMSDDALNALMKTVLQRTATDVQAEVIDPVPRETEPTGSDEGTTAAPDSGSDPGDRSDPGAVGSDPRPGELEGAD